MNKQTKRIFSKCTTKTKANRQMKLLRAIQNNRNFVPNSLQKKRQREQRRKQTLKKTKKFSVF